MSEINNQVIAKALMRSWRNLLGVTTPEEHESVQRAADHADKWCNIYQAHERNALWYATAINHYFDNR